MIIHLFGEKGVQEMDILATQEPNINQITDEMTTYSQALKGKFHVLLKPTPKARDRKTFNA